MSQILRALSCVLFAFAFVGCGQDNGSPVPSEVNAVLEPTCGPSDGWAVNLRVFDRPISGCDLVGAFEANLYLHGLGAFDLPPVEAPAIMVNVPEDSSGIAQRCSAGVSSCPTTTQWTLELDSYDEESDSTGVLELRFESTTQTFPFRARFCEPDTPLECG